MHFSKFFILLTVSLTSHTFVHAANAAAKDAAKDVDVKSFEAEVAAIKEQLPNWWQVAVLKDSKNELHFGAEIVGIPQGASLEQAKVKIGNALKRTPESFNLYPSYRVNDGATQIGGRWPFKNGASDEIEQPLTDLSRVNPKVGVCAFTQADVKAINDFRAAILANKKQAAQK